MKKKIQRFLGLGPCWHNIKHYAIYSFVYGSWAQCNLCGTRLEIHQV